MNIGYEEIALEYLRISDSYAYMPRAYVSDDLASNRLHIVRIPQY